VPDIVADVITERIYWIDYFRYTVESADYNGLERRVIYKQLKIAFFSLTLDTVTMT